MTLHAPPDPTSFTQAESRARAAFRILEAVIEMRDALDYRLWREDPTDTHLEADCQTWWELAQALVDFLRAKRSS